MEAPRMGLLKPLRQKALSWVLNGQNNAFSESNQTSYMVIARGRFPGVSRMGLPVRAQVISWTSEAAYNLRIWDVTHGEVIAELTGESNTIPELKAMSLGNLSLEEAIWEVQTMRVGGSASTWARCSGVDISW